MNNSWWWDTINKLQNSVYTRYNKVTRKTGIDIIRNTIVKKRCCNLTPWHFLLWTRGVRPSWPRLVIYSNLASISIKLQSWVQQIKRFWHFLFFQSLRWIYFNLKMEFLYLEILRISFQTLAKIKPIRILWIRINEFILAWNFFRIMTTIAVQEKVGEAAIHN